MDYGGAGYDEVEEYEGQEGAEGGERVAEGKVFGIRRGSRMLVGGERCGIRL